MSEECMHTEFAVYVVFSLKGCSPFILNQNQLSLLIIFLEYFNECFQKGICLYGRLLHCVSCFGMILFDCILDHLQSFLSSHLGFLSCVEF